MRVVDAHAHIWEADNQLRPWDLTRVSPAHNDVMTAGRLIESMDLARVDAAIVVTPWIYHSDNSYSLQAAAQYPDRLAVVGSVDLRTEDPDGVMRGWMLQPGMLGCRISLRSDRVLQWIERIDVILAAAGRHGVPVCLYPYVGLDILPQIARRHPDLQLIIDHLGLRRPQHTSTGEPFANLESVLALASYPNVAVKASAVPLQSREPFPFRDVWPGLHAVLAAFGGERVMWGSDLTEVSDSHSYGEAIDYIRVTGELSESDKEMLLGGALNKIFGWQPCEP